MRLKVCMHVSATRLRDLGAIGLFARRWTGFLRTVEYVYGKSQDFLDSPADYFTLISDYIARVFADSRYVPKY